MWRRVAAKNEAIVTAMMITNVQPEKIVKDLLRLSPEQQAALTEFIQRLNERGQPSEKISFLVAVDEFMNEHLELLKRLASDDLPRDQ